MTRLLLDTHVLLWTLYEPQRLSARTRLALVDNQNELIVSVVSAFEIASKFRIGKLDAADLTADFAGYLSRLGATELPVTLRHSLLAGTMPGTHRDPFDRILAAQSIVEGMQLVSGDALFDQFPVRRFW